MLCKVWQNQITHLWCLHSKSADHIYLPTEKSFPGTKCIMPCMYNHIICGLHSFIPRTYSYTPNNGKMYYNECQSSALRGILFLGPLRNMDYEWGWDQTCCGFNMYESFHLHWPQSFICHSRWGSGSTSDISESSHMGWNFWPWAEQKHITYSVLLLLIWKVVVLVCISVTEHCIIRLNAFFYTKVGAHFL